MSDSKALVDHFFRHESGRLVAVLTRSLGVSRLDLAEDVVQAALLKALSVWSRQGIPGDPAAWLYRTARNLAIDAIRKERTGSQVLSALAACEADSVAQTSEIQFDDEIGDEPLRMLFVCCHEAVPVESRVALALKTLCGFSVGEVSRALLCSEASAEKRISRAKARLREEGVSFEPPCQAQLRTRLDAVIAVIYLLFNEGYHSSTTDMPIRRDLCEEARRLARMLASHPAGDVPTVHALLALLCFHTARIPAREGHGGELVLLGEQNRLAWNWPDVREGMHWMALSAQGDVISRYHLEAAIAWEHCRATSFAATDWKQIARLYKTLDQIAPSPIHVLNWAVADAYIDGPQAGLARLRSVAADQVPTTYPGWHSVEGELRFRAGEFHEAEAAWKRALPLTKSMNDREHLRRRLEECQHRLKPTHKTDEGSLPEADK